MCSITKKQENKYSKGITEFYKIKMGERGFAFWL